MPKTKKQNSRVSSTIKKRSKKFQFKAWMGIIIVAIVAIVGIVVVYSSFASSLPSKVSGYADWRDSNEGQYSARVVSSNGWLCVDTNFDRYNELIHTTTNPKQNRYHWYVEVNDNAAKNSVRGWRQVRSSKEFQANGNKDHQCFNTNIHGGNIYRVKFKPENIVFIHGSYNVYGYYVDSSNASRSATPPPSDIGTEADETLPEVSSPENN